MYVCCYFFSNNNRLPWFYLHALSYLSIAQSTFDKDDDCDTSGVINLRSKIIVEYMTRKHTQLVLAKRLVRRRRDACDCTSIRETGGYQQAKLSGKEFTTATPSAAPSIVNLNNSRMLITIAAGLAAMEISCNKSQRNTTNTLSEESWSVRKEMNGSIYSDRDESVCDQLWFTSDRIRI